MYEEIGFTGRNGKVRLEISPRVGKEHPPLPDWLDIRFLLHVEGLPAVVIRQWSSLTEGIK
jgi:hypothetical protein